MVVITESLLHELSTGHQSEEVRELINEINALAELPISDFPQRFAERFASYLLNLLKSRTDNQGLLCLLHFIGVLKQLPLPVAVHAVTHYARHAPDIIDLSEEQLISDLPLIAALTSHPTPAQLLVRAFLVDCKEATPACPPLLPAIVEYVLSFHPALGALKPPQTEAQQAQILTIFMRAMRGENRAS